MIGKLNQQQVEDILQHQVIGRLGCCADGKSYVVPISYAYHENYIYAISREGMKVNIMRRNPLVCLQVDNITNMADWQSVIVWGQFEELKDKEQRNHALKKLIERKFPAFTSELFQLSPNWPFAPEDLETIPGVVYRIHLLETSGQFEINKAEDFYAT